MINLFSWLSARYRPWNKAVDPADETIEPGDRRKHFDQQKGEQVVLIDGAKTSFGQLLIRTLIDEIHDLEVGKIWGVQDFEEFVRLRERRKVVLELLNMIGSSEKKLRELERIIEGLPEDKDNA